MRLVRNAVFKYCISILCSFYILRLIDAQTHFRNLYLLLSGLILCALFFHFFNYIIEKFNTSLVDKRTGLISIAIAGLLMITLPRVVTNPYVEPHNFSFIKVTALGQKNDSAKSSEVWISGISNAGANFELKSFLPQKGWEEKNNFLASYKQQPSTLNVRIDDPRNAQIQFVMHAYSGKIKIEEDGKITIADLYKGTEGSDTYIYTSKKFIPFVEKYTNTDKTLFSIASFLALALLCYSCLLFAKIKKSYFLLCVPLSLIIFFVADYLSLAFTDKCLLLALSIACSLIMHKARGWQYISNYTNSKILFLTAALFGGFALIGHQLFLSEYPVTDVLGKSGYFILFCIWFSFIAVLFMYVTALCKAKIAATTVKDNNTLPSVYSTLKLYAIFSAILIPCWSIYLIAFYPGTMSSDSVGQWAQAVGIQRLNNAHPVFHTLILRLLLTIRNTPAMVGLAQIFTLTAISSSFFIYLYKAGIPFKWLIVYSILLGIIPVNGIYTVTLWKDVFFCYSLLWLTLVLAEIVTETYIFNYKITLICLAASLTGVALIRHNGPFAAVLISLFLIVWALKKRKRPIIVSVAAFLLILITYNKILVPYVFKARPLPEAYMLSGPVHSIASVIYYNGELTNETRQQMEQILPDSIWRKNYRPYNIDYYLFLTGTDFIQNLSAVPTSKVLKMYKTTFIHNPYLITRDRLQGCELLWNVYRADSSFNFTHQATIDKNKFGFTQKNSSLRSTLNQFINNTIIFTEAIFWRPGIYNIMLFFLLLCFIKWKKRYLFIFLPVIATNLSLLLSMYHQSFRFVYYVPLIFGFIWLLSLSKTISSDTDH